ncbi:ABC transporter ATP-binding protein [Elstera sp.]|jgi:ABC-type branched-subunit amino acid transport system ATPase component|uniref:ABC transporter ATP-binding protein n=1 Tax=Elstera sp. TaxID=1916664 RepID=UPI0037BF819A
MRGWALAASDLHYGYSARSVIDGLSLRVTTGARHALIGPNGAGKTTLIHLLTGFHIPQKGRLRLLGEDITHLPPEARVKRGLGRSFQINQLFPNLTPRTSLRLALAERDGKSGGWWKPLAGDAARDGEAGALLEQIGLASVADIETRRLPYGQQRLLEIALALALKPKVLLLDEPAAGVPRDESAALIDHLLALPASVTLLLIDHDMDLVFRFAERISVLVAGRILVEGSPAEIATNAEVRRVYLGEDSHV